MRRQNLLSRSGFSILEVLVVISILGVLAGLSYPAIKRIRVHSEEKALDSDVKTMNRAVSAYLASGGSIPSSATGEQVINKLKTKVSEELRKTIPGFSSSFIDPRITPHFLSSEERDTDRARVAWDPVKRKFYTTREEGSPGIKMFSLSQSASSDESGASTGEEEGNRSFAFQYSNNGPWIWDYEADAVKEKPLEPTLFSTTNVSLPDSFPVPVTGPQAPPEAPAPSALVVLDPPAFSLPSGSYPIRGFNMTVDLINPNPAGISDLVYSLDFGTWQYYPGGGIAVSPDSVLKARSVPNGAGYRSSSISEANYGVIPGQLDAPLVVLSDPRFPSFGTVSAGLTNPNDASVSRLDYRINGGAWQTYSGPFFLNASDWPGGATIEAYAVATSPHWLDSVPQAGTIDPAPVQLLAPAITSSAPNFMAGAVESISVTVTNTNPTGSALDYRLNGGAWLAYSAPFSVTRAAYATGLTVEARARSISPSYTDSPNASAAIGLTPVMLLTPAITRSAPNFMAGTVGTISVTVTNPNATGSALDYRLNGGAWTAYSGAFNVTRAAYPTGLTVEARARSTSPAYTDSGVASAAIGVVNAPPFAGGNGYTVVYTYTGTTPVITTTVLVNDSDPDGDPLTVVSVTQGANGAVTIDGTGNPLFTSSPAFIDGKDSFTYTISDGKGGFSTATVNINVNAKPVVVNETVTTMVNTPVSGNVLTNDWDYGGDPLIVEANLNPANGTVAINAAGNFTYTPNAGFTGSDSFRYTVADQEQGRTYGFVNITVTGVQLLTPSITRSAPNFMAGTVETISVTVTDPNATGSALDYRLNGGAWTAYSGAFNVTRATYPTGLTVEARARSTSPAYSNSANASSTIGLTPVQLLAPNITKSAPNFYASIVETITVTVTNPNPTGSVLDYRLNGGAWTAYSAAFNVTRAAYPTGLTVEARARATDVAYSDSPNASLSIGVGVSQLQVPVISPSAPNFMAGSVETITVTLTNPNPASSSTLRYRLNGGGWINYSSPFNLSRASYPNGLLVEAYAKKSKSAYTDSAISSVTIGLTPAQLQAPVINRSSPNFIAGSVETISVTITNPNATGSALDYRINGGAWTAYSAALSFTRATYPTGLTVEARARATNAAYSNSPNASSTIGLTPVPLQAPSINRSAPNFMAVSVETISVTVTNPNATGSALDYRLNGGAWTAYSGAFSVTRATYPAGVTVEARARATAPAYADSPNASAAIGLTPVPLQVPQVQTSADAFTRGVLASIDVTLVNPNSTGSALDYRLNGGAWQAYSGVFPVSLVTYSSGVIVEARARATDPAYSNSANASTTLGVLEALMTKLVDADADTSIAVTVPNWSGDNGQLYIQDHESSRALIYFNLADDITGPARIQSAVLYTTITAGGAPAGFPAYGVLPGLNWIGGGLTWNTAGNGLQTDGVELDAAPTAASVLCTTIPTVPGWSDRRSWDLTALAQRWVNNATTNNGLAIFPVAGQREIYCSREHISNNVKPKLYIQWNPLTLP